MFFAAEEWKLTCSNQKGRIYQERPIYNELQPQWNPRMSRIYANALNGWQQRNEYRRENARAKIPMQRIAVDFEDEITPLKRSVEVIQGEINDMQSEIANQQRLINSWRRSRTNPAVTATPQLQFKVPGPIEIDHLSLPGGSYSLSLSDKSGGSTAVLQSGNNQYQVALQRKASTNTAGIPLSEIDKSEAKRAVRLYLQQRAKALEAMRNYHNSVSSQQTDKEHVSSSLSSKEKSKHAGGNVGPTAVQSLRSKLSRQLARQEEETKILEEATRLKAKTEAAEAQHAKQSFTRVSNSVGKEAKDIIAKLLSKDLRRKSHPASERADRQVNEPVILATMN